MQKMVDVKINGREIEAQEGTTVLKAARKEGIDIPTLCFHEALKPAGLCRLCIVEVSGTVPHSTRRSCIQKVKEGLVVETDTEQIHRNRGLLLESLLGRAPDSKVLIDLGAKYGVREPRFPTEKKDNCILCGLCVRVCRERIGANALIFSHDGSERHVTTESDSLSEYCIGCGACAQICPTGAIRMEDRGDERKIYTRGHVIARHRLERCDSCGRPFAPQKFLDYINEKAYKPLGTELKQKLCSSCARNWWAESLSGLYPMSGIRKKK